jgi:hypothetical protein
MGPAAALSLSLARTSGLARLHFTEEFGEGLERFLGEVRSGTSESGDAVEAEGAEVGARLAPGDQRPLRAQK